MSSKKIARDVSNFITVKAAAALSSYTPAYLTRLAKKGDIEAKKEGRIWLIEAVSLEKYLSSIELRKVENRNRLRALRINKLNAVEYSAAWLFHKANTGAFDAKAALESLAIAGLSVLVGVMVQGFVRVGASTKDLYEGTSVVLLSFQEQTELLSVNLVEITTQIGVDSLLAGVWSLFF